MRIGIIYYGIQARNRGLDQLAQALIEIGHHPHIVSRNKKYTEQVDEFNGVPVIQLPRKPTGVSGFISLHLPINFSWTIWIVSLAKELKWDAIFLRETPLSLPGIVAARILSIPIFLDMRENLPATYAATRPKHKQFWKLTKLSTLSKFYEKKVLPHFDHIFTSTKELGEHVKEEYGIKANLQSVMGNYPSRVFLDQAQHAIKAPNRVCTDKVRLVFAGGISENRGVQDIVYALDIIRKKEKNYSISLHIIGEGPYLEELKKIVQSLGLNSLVEFLPLLPPSQVAKALASYDIGICSYLLSQQTHHTLPGKLFEYMAVGMPVLSSARKPVIRILEEFECGTIYHSRKATEIAAKILYLSENKKLREDMGRRGRNAVINHYNWKQNSKALDTVLQKY